MDVEKALQELEKIDPARGAKMRAWCEAKMADGLTITIKEGLMLQKFDGEYEPGKLPTEVSYHGEFPEELKYKGELA